MNLQKGFTLIELLLVLAIGTIISLTAIQLNNALVIVPVQNVNRFTAVYGIDIMTTYLIQDLLETQSITITSNQTTMEWTDYTGNQTTHTVTYEFDSPIVQRSYDDEEPAIVGRNISDLTFATDNNTISVNITAFGSSNLTPTKTFGIQVVTRSELEVQ